MGRLPPLWPSFRERLGEVDPTTEESEKTGDPTVAATPLVGKSDLRSGADFAPGALIASVGSGFCEDTGEAPRAT